MGKQNLFDSSKFEYYPVTYTSCVSLYDRIRDKLVEKNYEDSLLYKNCEYLITHLPNLFEIAEKSCCGQIRANGYFSICKQLFRFLECIEQELYSKKSDQKLKEDIELLNEISILIAKMTEICEIVRKETNLEDEVTEKRLTDELSMNYPEFHQKLQIFRRIKVKKGSTNSKSIDNSICDQLNNNISIYESSHNSFTIESKEFDSLPLFTPHLSTIFKVIYEGIYQIDTPNKYLMYQKHFMFWLEQDLRSFFRLYTFVLPFLRVRFYRYFQLIFSSDYRAKVLNHILTLVS